MGPVAYLASAVVLRAWRLAGGDLDQGMSVVRLSGAIPWVALMLGTRRVLTTVAPRLSDRAIWTGVALATASPMVVAMSMSVQNDTVALAILVWLMASVLRRQDHASPWRAAGHGAAGAAAVLTKLTVAPAVAVILVWPALRRGRRGLPETGVAALAVVAGTSWWFLRNLALYGDPTGRSAAPPAGVVFTALGWQPFETPARLLRSATTYLWVPVEYYRNTIASPTTLDLLMVIVTGVILVLGVSGLRGCWSPGATLVAAVAGVSVIAWAWTAVMVQSVAFRTAYAALPFYALLAAVAVDGSGRAPRLRTGLAGACGVALVVAHAWTLAGVSHVPWQVEVKPL
jgi:D-alanyl-D-alanine carboxypeptidase (penicillin-binding protein 5/6)